MSTLCKVPFESLHNNGSNYYLLSTNVLIALRTMGPSFVRAVETSILPKDFDDLSKLSKEEWDCMFHNCCVVDPLFENMDRELSDLMHKNKKLQKLRLDAHHLWKFIEAIFEHDSDDEEEEESLEEYTTIENCTQPIITPSEDKESRSRSKQVYWFPIGTGQTGLGDRSD